jgi:RHS repeat-associated protein
MKGRLDYSDQRFYTSHFGRFMSADRFRQAARANDSGSWNKYAYTIGDPVNRLDNFGTCSLNISSMRGVHANFEPCGPDPYTPTPTPNPGSPDNPDPGGPGGPGSPDVSKNYSETIKCNETSGQLLSHLESNFGNFANYSGTFGPLGAASANVPFSGTVAKGSTITIVGTNTMLGGISQTQTVAVTVSALGPNGFTFTTLPGHVLYPATISFSATTGANGQLTFGIAVNGNCADASSKAMYNIGGNSLENNIWNNLLNNVQKDCNH